jgi:cell division protease FtsH
MPHTHTHTHTHGYIHTRARAHRRYHHLTLTLLKASWRRAQALVASRADAIRAVADALLAAPDEKLSGERLVEIIEVRVRRVLV